MRQGESINGSIAARRAESAATEAEHLGRQFGRLFDDIIESALAGLFSSAAEIGLGFAELRILRALARSPAARGDSSLDEAGLASETGLSATAVSEALSTLENLGLSTSTATGTVSIAPAGYQQLRDLRNKRHKALSEFVEARSHGERLRLAAALHLLDVHFDRRLQLPGSDRGA